MKHADAPPSTHAPPRTTGLIARGLAFGLIFVALQLGWQSLDKSSMHDFVVHDCTVRPAVALVNLLTPTIHARAQKITLTAPGGGGLNIVNGCEGTEALFLLAAAFAVAPLSWGSRLLGFALGIGVVFVVNQARILALFYAFRNDASLFDLLHGSITPIAVILLVCAYFYGWLVYAPRLAGQSPTDAAAY